MIFKILLMCLPFLVGCSSFFYYPTKNHIFLDPKKIGYEPEDVYFTDVGNRKLHGWWFPSAKKPAKATVVFFHGNAENLSSHFLQLAWLTDSGYNLFIYDFPGYGYSEGKPNPQSCVESGYAAVDWVVNRTSKNEPLVIYGQSLGGIIALRTALDKKSNLNLKLVVADSTFSSFQTIAKGKLSQSWLTWLLQPLSYILLSDNWAPKNLKDLSPIPTLVIHGQLDRGVEPEHGEKIFAELSEPKTIWRIPDGTHIDVYWRHNRKYRTQFLDYLKSLGI